MNTQRKMIPNKEHMINMSVVKTARAKKCHENSLPVIKISFSGDILYANLASLPLMGEWGCSANQKLPEWFLTQFSGIFNPSSCHELKIPFSNCAVHFTAVPFAEAGYVGLYAHTMEDVSSINPIS